MTGRQEATLRLDGILKVAVTDLQLGLSQNGANSGNTRHNGAGRGEAWRRGKRRHVRGKDASRVLRRSSAAVCQEDDHQAGKRIIG